MWNTPTPIPQIATPALSIDSSQMGVGLAESMVQGWHSINSAGILDVVMLLVLIGIVTLGIWAIIQRVQQL